jgi:serine/threonine protein kinase
MPVYEAGDDDGLLFIAMRLGEGTDLARVLARGPLEPARAALLIGQLGAAVDAAHAHRLIHRDVKPANILLTSDQPEHLYLTDFGVAKQVGAGSGVTRAGEWVGTLDYLGPEQIRGELLSGAADIYAIAGVLYHCLTGEVPFPRDNDAAQLWAHVNAPPPAPSQLIASLPMAIDEVIAIGMAKDPALRFPSGAELARACAEALGVRIPAPAAEVPPQPVASSREVAPTVISE